MKSRPRRLVLALALVCSAAPALADDDACLDRAARAVQARYDGVSDLSARFEQTTRTATTGATAAAPVTSRGKVVLVKPGKMRWTYEEPEPSLVVSDGETLWLYDPSFGEAQRMPASTEQFGGAAGQFLLGAGDMRRDFDVRAVSCAEWSVELELVPREPATYEKLYLIVDPGTGDVRRSRVVDLVGNSVTLEFRDLRTNPSAVPSLVGLDAPVGVAVLELEPCAREPANRRRVRSPRSSKAVVGFRWGALPAKGTSRPRRRARDADAASKMRARGP